MQITITGPRNSGKSTLAAFLAKTLRRQGMQVKIYTPRQSVTAAIDEESFEEEIDLSRSATVSIVTDFEHEDESDVE